MTTRALPAVANPKENESTSDGLHLRRLDVRRDLASVADLIQHAFADELDQSGFNALREMRALGRIGPFTSLFNYFSPNFRDMFDGFVWETNGQIVGNITVQRFDTYGQRWTIANVAVAPPFRGQGIARRLVNMALEYIRERGGDWAILQVRRNNDIARGLYERLGFETLGGVSQYRLERSTSAPSNDELPTMETVAPLRPMSAQEWYATYELAVAATPNLMQWWRPLRADHFQIYAEQRLSEAFLRLAGHSRVMRLIFPASVGSRHLHAFMTLHAALGTAFGQSEHGLQLYVHPDVSGQYEYPLLRHALTMLDTLPPLPVHVAIQAAHTATADALLRLGFSEERTLLTMRKRL